LRTKCATAEFYARVESDDVLGLAVVSAEFYARVESDVVLGFAVVRVMLAKELRGSEVLN